MVEDHAIVREGISSLLALADDIEVIGAAASAEEALMRVPGAKPDVLLLDIKLPNLSGVELIRRLSAEGELPPTLILTTFEDDELLFDGLRAGARGYLLKDISLERLLEAIREIAKGGNCVEPAITERLLQAARRGDGVPHGTPLPMLLTDRETDVLRLLASGYSNREIARALAVSVGTVKNHVSSILGKLGVRDRTRAVLKGLQSGLL